MPAPVSGSPFAVSGRVAVVTGGYGVLGGAIAAGLARAGAVIAILGRRPEAAAAQAAAIRREGGDASVLIADVLDEGQVRRARDELLKARGTRGLLGTEQNGNVLAKPDGSYTDRARAIVAHTPMGRLGTPEEVVGAVQWLCSDAAAFVTGVVLPVDGGFSVSSGV